jgi:cation:H+ antiporter
MWHLFLLLIGFAPLIFGANILIINASSLAKKLNIPSIVIALTIVGFGTSSPEMVVNIIASTQGNSPIVLGNIIGSNILNILLILGISALFYPVVVKGNTTWLEIPLSFLSAVVILIVANDVIIDRAYESVISRIDGIILLLFFTVFIVYNISLALKGNFSGADEIKEKNVVISIILIITGLLLLAGGGRIIVYAAVKVAESMGLDERIIALTIISIGTSLPELATTIVAALKKSPDIAIGNIVGSNIFNVFFVLGISAVIHPVKVDQSANIDLLVNLISSALLFIFVLAGSGRRISRFEGGLFVATYIAYLIFIIYS